MNLFLFFHGISVALAAPAGGDVSTPTVTISSPEATTIGISGDVEQFLGIPFALPPTGSLRLKPLEDNGKACPQMLFSTEPDRIVPTKLPVLFWIYGGGFETGFTSMYGGSSWVKESVTQNKPIIFVGVNYRVSGFGFLLGSEILNDGSANLGLLDQRLELQWVADNPALVEFAAQLL